jgi:hypothetical protein
MMTFASRSTQRPASSSSMPAASYRGARAQRREHSVAGGAENTISVRIPSGASIRRNVRGCERAAQSDNRACQIGGISGSWPAEHGSSRHGLEAERSRR